MVPDLGERSRFLSTSAVDVGPMIDMQHRDSMLLVANLVDDAIRTASRRPQTGELAQ
jgi:hypothetical protein